MAGDVMMTPRGARRKMRTGCYGNGCYSGAMTPERVGIDAYVLDVLMADLIAHDRQPSAFVLYLWLWRVTNGGRKSSGAISLRDLSDRTGLSKRAVQDAIDRLSHRQLITVERTMPTAVATYKVLRPWVR